MEKGRKNFLGLVLCLFVAASMMLSGCGDDNGDDKKDGNLITGGAGVYVAGSLNPTSFLEDQRFTLWKDGIATRISNNRSNATSVFVSGNDVYAVGWESADGETFAIVSKNGVTQRLTGGYRLQADCIFVSGGDVYIAGSGHVDENAYARSAIVWKNGVAQYLLTDSEGSYDEGATSVFVSGNDVYVVGYGYYEYYQLRYAVLWKNGVVQYLSSDYRRAIATSVFVSGSDVYVAGQESCEAILWKNGVAQNLDFVNQYECSGAHSVFVSGSDVYVAGFETSDVYIQGINVGYYGLFARLWKNGVAQNLTDGTARAEATSVFVSGDDVYVVGTVGYGRPIAKLWKNGDEQDLSDGTTPAQANSVYVSR